MLGVAHDRMVKAMAVLAAGRPWVVLLPGSRRLSFQKAQPFPLPRPTPPRYRPAGLSRHPHALSCAYPATAFPSFPNESQAETYLPAGVSIQCTIITSLYLILFKTATTQVGFSFPHFFENLFNCKQPGCFRQKLH